MLVELRRLTRREVHLPDAHALVLEQEAVRDVAELAVGHRHPRSRARITRVATKRRSAESASM